MRLQVCHASAVFFYGNLTRLLILYEPVEVGPWFVLWLLEEIRETLEILLEE